MALRFQIGRQRYTSRAFPHEAGYGRAVDAQMKQIIQNMQKVIDGIKGASPDALLYAVRPIYDESQRLVPVKTGRLKRSGFLEARVTTKGATAVVGYAKGGNPHYAAMQHERMDFRHAEPTQAKYLQEPAMKHIPNIPNRYAEFIRARLGL